jgi:K+-sensing histidine kinase KdpD
MEHSWFRSHLGWVRLLAALVPLAMAGGLQLSLSVVTNTSAALILVLAVVGAASTGDRLAGVLAAASAALGFDFFLTQPYLQLRIDDPGDIELAVLLLAVGVAVSELASWGIRRSLEATQQSGFVQGVLEASALAGGSVSTQDGLERTSDGIRRILAADLVSFVAGEHDASAVIIQPDGTFRRHGEVVDVARRGLPDARFGYCAIPIAQQGAQLGYFRVDLPATARPSRDQLRVAALLAAQWTLRPLPRSAVRAPRAGDRGA